MFNFFSQTKAQIMIVNNHGLRLFIWQNKILTFHSSFTDTPENHVLLSETLVKSPASPLIIITNFMEESFLNETAAHVTGSDQKTLLERRLSYAFRTTPYRVAKVIGREDDGRRDDKILLSALTKPELLKPWLKVLLEKEFPIQSISSAAYLTEAFALETGAAKEEHLLLVSLERGTELRQTYLKKGRILFSRLTLISEQDTSALVENIYKESLQIRSYLERIKMLPYNEILKIKIYSPFNNHELLINQRTTELNTFENLPTNEQATLYSLQLDNPESNAIRLFLAYTLSKGKVPNIYAPFSIRKFFYLNTMSKSLVCSAVALLIIFIGLKIPTLLSTMENWDQQQVVTAQTLPLTAEYDILSRRFPETPIPSEEMALVVESYEKIKQQSYLPIQTMEIISEALTASPDLKITAIQWSLHEAARTTRVDPSFGSFQPRGAASSENSFQQAILEQRTALTVLIDGIAYSPSSYREAQNQVSVFTDALSNYPGFSVTPLKMPTDVSLDTTVQTNINGDELRAPFTLELTIIEAVQ